VNWSLFLLRNISKEKIYWEGNGSFSKNYLRTRKGISKSQLTSFELPSITLYDIAFSLQLTGDVQE